MTIRPSGRRPIVFKNNRPVFDPWPIQEKMYHLSLVCKSIKRRLDAINELFEGRAVTLGLRLRVVQFAEDVEYVKRLWEDIVYVVDDSPFDPEVVALEQRLTDVDDTGERLLSDILARLDDISVHMNALSVSGRRLNF